MPACLCVRVCAIYNEATAFMCFADVDGAVVVAAAAAALAAAFSASTSAAAVSFCGCICFCFAKAGVVFAFDIVFALCFCLFSVVIVGHLHTLLLLSRCKVAALLLLRFGIRLCVVLNA